MNSAATTTVTTKRQEKTVTTPKLKACKIIWFSMATYSPEVTLVRSAVVKGAPEITPGNRVTRDVMRVGLNDKPVQNTKTKRMGRQKKKRKDPVFER